MDRIKNNKIFSVIVLIAGITIWISDIAESINNISSYAKDLYTNIYNESSHLLEEIVNDVNSKNEEYNDFSESYSNLLSIIGENDPIIVKASKWNEQLYASNLGKVTFISTTDQYKMDGFAVFLDSRTGKVLLKDTEFPLGINGIKIFGKANVSPNQLVIVKYITITGTGTFGESVRFYTIDDGLVLTSLDKPFSEVNSGWHAFETDTVEFKTKNDIILKNNVMEIHTIGIAVVHGEQLEYRELPQEIYVWKPNSRSFEQTEGRLTHKQGLMTSIYSDIAGAAGDWFKKPTVLQSGSLKDVFQEEQW